MNVAGRGRHILPVWAEALAAGLLLAVATTVIYRVGAAQGAAYEMAAPWWLDTPLDRALPTVPAAVWIYLTWYPAIPLLALFDHTTLRRGYVAVTVAFLACSLGHVLLPVRIERTQLAAAGGLSVQVLAWLYAFDPPRNLFPSFHAAAAFLLAALWPPAGPRRWMVSLWVVMLCASCVLIKQHYVVDVVAGAAVGLGAAALAKHLFRGQDIDLSPAATARSAALAGTMAEARRMGPLP